MCTRLRVEIIKVEIIKRRTGCLFYPAEWDDQDRQAVAGSPKSSGFVGPGFAPASDRAELIRFAAQNLLSAPRGVWFKRY